MTYINWRISAVASAATMILVLACSSSSSSPGTAEQCRDLPDGSDGCVLTVYCQDGDAAVLPGDQDSGMCNPPAGCGGAISLLCSEGATPNPALSCTTLGAVGGGTGYCCPCVQE